MSNDEYQQKQFYLPNEKVARVIPKGNGIQHEIDMQNPVYKMAYEIITEQIEKQFQANFKRNK